MKYIYILYSDSLTIKGFVALFCKVFVGLSSPQIPPEKKRRQANEQEMEFGQRWSASTLPKLPFLQRIHNKKHIYVFCNCGNLHRQELLLVILFLPAAESLATPLFQKTWWAATYSDQVLWKLVTFLATHLAIAPQSASDSEPAQATKEDEVRTKITILLPSNHTVHLQAMGSRALLQLVFWYCQDSWLTGAFLVSALSWRLGFSKGATCSKSTSRTCVRTCEIAVSERVSAGNPTDLKVCTKESSMRARCLNGANNCQLAEEWKEYVYMP